MIELLLIYVPDDTFNFDSLLKSCREQSFIKLARFRYVPKL